MSPAEVRALLAATLGITDAQVRDELAFGDVPEWDSLQHVELMLALEARLGVEIGPEEIVELTTVALIIDFARDRSSAGETSTS